MTVTTEKIQNFFGIAGFFKMKNALAWNVYLNQLYGITIESQEVNIFFGSPVS